MIDDFLPVDEYDNLIFANNRETPNEFWVALLEKAYCKVVIINKKIQLNRINFL